MHALLPWLLLAVVTARLWWPHVGEILRWVAFIGLIVIAWQFLPDRLDSPSPVPVACDYECKVMRATQGKPFADPAH